MSLPIEKLSAALMNFGNFLSICKKDHNEAINILKEVSLLSLNFADFDHLAYSHNLPISLKTLKLQLKSSNGQMSPNSASTLSSMGKVFMRRSKVYNNKEGIKDAKRAEGCFLRALQLYRASMFGNANEKVVDTLFNLNEARERQTTNKSILRKVRFKKESMSKSNSSDCESEPTFKNTKLKTNNVDSIASSRHSYDDTRSEWSKDSRSLYSSSYWEDDSVNWGNFLGLGYRYICNCGALNVNESKTSREGPPGQVVVL